MRTMDNVSASPMTPYESQYTRKRSQGYVQYLGRYMYFDNEGVVWSPQGHDHEWGTPGDRAE